MKVIVAICVMMLIVILFLKRERFVSPDKIKDIKRFLDNSSNVSPADKNNFLTYLNSDPKLNFPEPPNFRMYPEIVNILNPPMPPPPPPYVPPPPMSGMPRGFRCTLIN